MKFVWSLEDQNGDTISDREAILDKWKEYTKCRIVWQVPTSTYIKYCRSRTKRDQNNQRRICEVS